MLRDAGHGRRAAKPTVSISCPKRHPPSSATRPSWPSCAASTLILDGGRLPVGLEIDDSST